MTAIPWMLSCFDAEYFCEDLGGFGQDSDGVKVNRVIAG